MTERTPCPRHPNRQPAPGSPLCTGCHTRYHDDLTYIAHHWPHLPDLHTATRTGGGIHPIHPNPPTPCRIDILDLETDLTAILHAWATLVAEERRLTTMPREAAQQALWLTKHANWTLSTPYALDAVLKAADARHKLARAIGDTPRGQNITCGCTNTLRADLTDPDALITCRACGTTTTTGMLLRIAATGHAGETTPLDAEAIQKYTGISRTTLDRWARAGHIQRTHGRYWLSQVIAHRDTTRTPPAHA